MDEDVIGTEEVMDMAGEESSGGFFDFLGGLTDYLSDPNVLLPGLLGGLLTGSAYERLSDVGSSARSAAEALAQQQLEQTQFKPFTVATATGSQYGTQIDPRTGQFRTTMALSPQEKAMQQQLFGGASQFFTGATADPAVREQEIYDQIRAATSPQERMERLGLEERLAAQGRLGVRTAQFGGTPEQLAMERAQQQAMAQARLGAAQQARQEQLQQANLGQQFLGTGYIPQNQLLGATAPAQQLAALQNALQRQGATLFGEASMSGLEAQMLQEQARANLLGQIGSGLLTGAFSPQQSNPYAGLFEGLSKLFPGSDG
jgi:hypothetical protein